MFDFQVLKTYRVVLVDALPWDSCSTLDMLKEMVRNECPTITADGIEEAKGQEGNAGTELHGVGCMRFRSSCLETRKRSC